MKTSESNLLELIRIAGDDDDFVLVDIEISEDGVAAVNSHDPDAHGINNDLDRALGGSGHAKIVSKEQEHAKIDKKIVQPQKATKVLAPKPNILKPAPQIKKTL
jgi:hypothetical protein